MHYINIHVLFTYLLTYMSVCTLKSELIFNKRQITLSRTLVSFLVAFICKDWQTEYIPRDELFLIRTSPASRPADKSIDLQAESLIGDRRMQNSSTSTLRCSRLLSYIEHTYTCAIRACVHIWLESKSPIQEHRSTCMSSTL